MYLLFVFPEPPEGYPGGGMNDFAGLFDYQHAATKYVESQPRYEGTQAQIVEVATGLATERCAYDHIVEYPVLESLTVILEGQRLGHHEGSHWEWKKVKKVHHLVANEQIEHGGHDTPLESSRSASQEAVEDFLERNPVFHATLQSMAPSLFGESESEDL